MLEAFASGPFRRFWSSTALTVLGASMQSFALGYFTVQLAVQAGSPQLGSLYLGFVGVAHVVPGVILYPFGGVLADRVDRRKLLVITQSASVLTSAVLAALIFADRVDLMVRIAFAGIGATLAGFSSPARQSIVPSLVPPERLVSAIGMNSASYYLPQFLGPLIAGVLFVPFGIGGLLALTAAMQMASLLALLLALPYIPQHIRQAAPPSVLRSLREGAAYAWADQVTRWCLLLFLGAALAVRAYDVLLPAFSEQVLRVGAVELSWLLAANGAGALTGTIATAAFGRIERRGRLLVLTGGCVALLVWLFSLQRVLPSALVVLYVTGFAEMLFVGMANTVLQIRTPSALRGRVLSLSLLFGSVGGPVGLAVLGWLGSIVGVDRALQIGAVAFAVLVVVALLRARELWGATIRPRRSGEFARANSAAD